MSRRWPQSPRGGPHRGDDRAQIVLVAAAVVAVAFLSMTLAYAQLGYDADRTAAGAVDVASLAEIDRSLTASFRAAVRDAETDVGRDVSWRDRRSLVERIRTAVGTDIDRLERSHADESRAVTVTFDDAAATRWAAEHCPSGRGRDFGPCRAIDGVVVQERAGETTVVAAAVSVRIVSPAESTTATLSLRAV
ncbi:hypothetical protein D3D02_04910 [Halobellus sp. Atlit-38R]|uniref:DUF7261 family protein n=1 Tax=Halobellus sp. Atlit-38R TaxID=2282131 RepID=UPI000EF1D0D9|nr:hypothetical protein [Halobellus sp. Atlit-38R]RLM90123.1 hypothetical protein D3D02_04910 [Halobellus sp. Atlit-38R]